MVRDDIVGGGESFGTYHGGEEVAGADHRGHHLVRLRRGHNGPTPLDLFQAWTREDSILRATDATDNENYSDSNYSA